MGAVFHFCPSGSDFSINIIAETQISAGVHYMHLETIFRNLWQIPIIVKMCTFSKFIDQSDHTSREMLTHQLHLMVSGDV